MVNKRLLDWAMQYIGESPENRQACIDLSDLTIIVPTYKRSNHAIRTMAYWSRQRAYVSLMDGSPEALHDDFIKAIEGIKNLSYCHAPTSLPERIRMAIARSRTKYVMCLADDDFYLPSGLSAAMRLLEMTKHAEACMGQSVGLDVYKNSRPYFFSYGESLRDYRVVAEAAAERMRQGITDYRSAAFYAVYRKKAFEEIWKEIHRSSCPEQIEYEQAMRAYMAGALVTSPQIYWIRSFECDPVASPIDGARSTNFPSWFCSPAYDEEKNEFIDRLTLSLRKHTNASEPAARALIQDLCDLIVAGSHVGLTSPPSPVAEIIIRLKTFLAQARAAGFINNLRNSEMGIKLRTQFLYSSRKKFEPNSPDFSEDVAEASEILTFVGHFLAANGGDSQMDHRGLKHRNSR